MDGEGLSTRALGERAGVSHAAIANWLSDTSRASPTEVAKVASVFGWTHAELYDGQPRFGVMTTLARLEGFRARVSRLAAGLVAEAEPTRFDHEIDIQYAEAPELEDEVPRSSRRRPG